MSNSHFIGKYTGMDESENFGAYETQEDLQKKLYFMNEQLQLMVQDLPT